jgi:hypothetical protein
VNSAHNKIIIFTDVDMSFLFRYPDGTREQLVVPATAQIKVGIVCVCVCVGGGGVECSGVSPCLNGWGDRQDAPVRHYSLLTVCQLACRLALMG